MGAPVDRHRPGPWYLGREQPPDAPDVGLVEGAEHDERRHGDLLQARACRRIERALGAGLTCLGRCLDPQIDDTALHLPDERPNVRVDSGGIPRRPVDPGAQIELDDAVEIPLLQQLVLALVVGRDLLRPVPGTNAGCDEAERTDAPWMLERSFHSDPRPLGGPDERRPLDREVVEESDEIVDVENGPLVCQEDLPQPRMS